jgi:hypothetical protein
MKVEEVEQLALNVHYEYPTQSVDKWTDDDYIFNTIHMMFKNQILWKTCHIILGMFPLSKVFYKIMLKKFIKQYQ